MRPEKLQRASIGAAGALGSVKQRAEPRLPEPIDQRFAQDEEYGKAPAFVRGLDDRKLAFVGEVPKSLSCLAVQASLKKPDTQVKGRRAEDVVRQSPAFLKQPWLVVKLSRETVGPQVWEVKAAPVWQVRDKQWSNGKYWLIWARNVATGEETPGFVGHTGSIEGIWKRNPDRMGANVAAKNDPLIPNELTFSVQP